MEPYQSFPCVEAPLFARPEGLFGFPHIFLRTKLAPGFPTSFGQKFSQKISVTKSEKIVKVCLHSSLTV